MATNRPPIPIELLSLRSAITAFMAMLRDAESFCEVAADVNRIVQPDYARRLDALRSEISLAQRAGRVGTVAAIGQLVAQLLGEA